MLGEILTALALVLVIEGLLPFASPSLYRAMVETMAELPPERLRMAGLMMMLGGVGLLVLVR